MFSNNPPAIIEPAVAPIIFCERVAFEFHDDTVWVSVLTTAGDVLIRQATIVLTTQAFAKAANQAVASLVRDGVLDMSAPAHH